MSHAEPRTRTGSLVHTEECWISVLWRSIWAISILWLVPTAGAWADPIDRLPPLSDLELPTTSAPPAALPPLDSLPSVETQSPGGTTHAASPSLSRGASVAVREFRVVGGSALEPDALAGLLRPYTGRVVSTEELIEARDAVTDLYRTRGYVSSRAILPDQQIRDGIVELRLVEGELAEVEIEGARTYSEAYLARWIGAQLGPLNVEDLTRRLEVLQQERGIERVDARLEPGAALGQDRLRVEIEEASPWMLSLDAANDVPGSLGGRRAGGLIGHANLTGVGDPLLLGASQVRGLFDFDVSYERPINLRDTRVALRYRSIRSEVVRGAFDDFDVRNERQSWRVELSHPLWRSRDRDVRVGLVGEHSRSELEVLGEPFSFRPSEENDGETRVTALRAFVDTRVRTATQVWVARLQLSLGIDALDATIYPSRLPGSKVADGEFVSWLLQVQWAARLDRWLPGSQLLVRMAGQVTPDALLDAERFAVGGEGTVRGYHANELVRDNGFAASVELRYTVLRDALGRERLQVGPFVDFGKAWDRDSNASLESISSIGLAARWRVTEQAELALSWGHRLRKVDDREGDDLQDAGIYAAVRVATF